MPWRDLRDRERIAVKYVRRMIVRIDESRREHEPGAVDHAFACGGRDAANVADGVAVNPDDRRAQRLPGSIRHLSAKPAKGPARPCP
jgi:hypothetical protein